MLEGGVLTFFKDSKTSAAGGLVRPRLPGQGPLHPFLIPVGVWLAQRLGLRPWNMSVKGAGP